MQKRIYLCLAHMSGKEQRFIQEAFDTNWVVPLGPNVNGFEEDLKQFVNTRVGASPMDKEMVALSSGTAAIHLALIACGVQAGDEVICQTFTFCASANPVTYVGATPVFVDSEAGSWNIDPELLERAIIDRKAKTGKYPKAIIPVALYGMPYRIEEIMAINIQRIRYIIVQRQQDDYHLRRRCNDMQGCRSQTSDHVAGDAGTRGISVLPA